MCLVLQFLFLIAVCLIAFKLYLKLTFKWNPSHGCLIGKTALVTGANGGIGLCVARDFAKRGAKVILACRDLRKAQKARLEVEDATGNSNLRVIQMDLASLDSIRRAVKEVVENEERLDILVNGAGVAGLDDGTTEDGLQLLMQINYFGPFLLTLLLADLLEKSSGRVINIQTNSISFSRIDPQNLNRFHKGFFGKTLNYADSKLCLHLSTLELSKKLRNATINSVHPGTTDTDIFRKLPRSGRIIADLLRCFFQTPQEGAQTIVYASVSRDVGGISGKYFENCGISGMSEKLKTCKDGELARQLWKKTLQLLKVNPNELNL